VRRAVAAGVTIAMGTDIGNYSSGRNGTELALMCEAGLSPMQAIVASTRDAARCLRIEEETGTLESGKLADLIIVDGDPLVDVALLGDPDRVRLVVQGGRTVKDLGAG
jgi:imidazolonepropionase-like amidohydrolase